MTVFNFQSYRIYLEQLLKSYPNKGHGLKSVWAKVMDCHVTFVSHVLNGHYDLNQEQAEALCRHLNLNDDESEYFLLLIFKEKAGNHQLKEFYSRLLQKKLKAQDNVRERIEPCNSIASEDQATYYSHWLYSAMHLLLSIPEFQDSPEKIAAYFNKPLSTVQTILSFLESRQIVSLKNGRYQTPPISIFLDKSSPFHFNNQICWRQKAIGAIYDKHPEHLHYTTVFTLSKEDTKKIKDLLLKAIQDAAEIIRPSPEEKLYSVAIDFFEVK